MIVLLGVVVVILGFVTRRNPALVVGVAGIVTGLLGKMDPLEVLAAFGRSFADSRSVTVFAIVLPVIGLLERYGLREQARRLIGRLGKLSATVSSRSTCSSVRSPRPSASTTSAVPRRPCGRSSRPWPRPPPNAS